MISSPLQKYNGKAIYFVFGVFSVHLDLRSKDERNDKSEFRLSFPDIYI